MVWCPIGCQIKIGHQITRSFIVNKVLDTIAVLLIKYINFLAYSRFDYIIGQLPNNLGSWGTHGGSKVAF